MSLILVTGGVRAGKSAFAERLAREAGGDSVCYVATAEPLDDEMAARIAAHRAARPAGWVTVEAPRAVVAALPPPGAARVVLLDCLTLLVSNILLACPESAGVAAVWPVVEAEVDAVVRYARSMPTVIVTNEVGLGVVPPTKLGRVYRDLLGMANQRLAAAAEAVYLVVAGIPVDVKSLAACQPGGKL